MSRAWIGPVTSLALALALAAATLVGPGSALTPARGAAAPPRCHTGDLSGVVHRGSPGAGQRYATVVLRNRTGHTCTVFGYVGMLLLNRHGHALPTRVVRDHSRHRHHVQLRPGARASTLLHWSGLPSPSEPQRGACEATPARVEVTPPDETTRLLLRWRSGPVCERGRIRTLPLRAGTRGS